MLCDLRKKGKNITDLVFMTMVFDCWRKAEKGHNTAKSCGEKQYLQKSNFFSDQFILH